MIAGLTPIAVNSVPFAAMSLAVILIAWSRWRAFFPCALACVSAIMLLSWSRPLDLAALLLFLGPPFLAIRLTWGRGESAPPVLPGLLIAWEVLLFVYLRKYSWVGSFGWLDHPFAVIGLSYMLFRAIHLLVEAPRLGHLPFSAVRYGTYMVAFWTLLSGPIQRYEAFCEGLAAAGRPDTDAALEAAHRAINGLIKAFLIAPVFLKASDISALSAPGADWIDFAIVLYAYPVYIYLNFSGYTDLMIAVARLCGVTTMPENFNRPYLARNLLDFWGRWHISFGTWIRHYVFTPLSQNLLRATQRRLHDAMLVACVIVTFVIVGAWHGTTLNFLIFGLLHGAGIVVAAVYGAALRRLLGREARKAFERHPFVRAASVFLCFNYVCATILLFPNQAGDLGRILGGFLGTHL